MWQAGSPSRKMSAPSTPMRSVPCVDEPDVFVFGEAVEEGDGAEGGVDLFAA